ncbi:ATP-NAD kinase, partial [Peniophora sp. CONT]
MSRLLRTSYACTQATSPILRALARICRPRSLKSHRVNAVARSRAYSTVSGPVPWQPSNPPESILFVNKLRTKPVLEALHSFLAHIRSTYPNVRVFHPDTPEIAEGVELWQPHDPEHCIDLVLTLGGDGTILHASSLFKVGAVPPVLSFSMGTLGFLLPFHVDDFARALESVFTGKATVLHRMRLMCEFYDKHGEKYTGSDSKQDWQVMNEVALHRGASPHLNTIDAFVDGQHLTEAVSDGLIVSTPTGSTAYSLSAGGPIVHPSLSAMVLTPICPRSLSFRPLVFPDSSSITLRIGANSRAPAGVSMDGQVSRVLEPGDSVTVRASEHPIPCINRSSLVSLPAGGEGVPPGKEDDWVRDINNLLQYNATFRSKALTTQNSRH